MSERYPWPVNVAYETEFYVFDSADAAVTGLVNANFTKQLSKDGVNSAVAVTVTEIDAANQPGRYKAVYTPNAQGYWSLRVSHATHNKRGWQDDIQVYAEEVLAGSKQTGDSFARLGAPTGASVSADIATRAAPADVPTANANADALLDRANGVETGWTLRQVLRVIAAVLFGKSSGQATAPVFRSVTDAKNRVTATVDVSGNRTAVTTDGT